MKHILKYICLEAHNAEMQLNTVNVKFVKPVRITSTPPSTAAVNACDAPNH